MKRIPDDGAGSYRGAGGDGNIGQPTAQDLHEVPGDTGVSKGSCSAAGRIPKKSDAIKSVVSIDDAIQTLRELSRVSHLQVRPT